MSFLQKSAIFISKSRVSHKTVNCDRLQKSTDVKMVSFEGADTTVIFQIIKDHLGGIRRDLESNLLNNLVKIAKNQFSPKSRIYR